MLRYLIVISALFSTVAFGQDLPENAADALNNYISLREGYKRSDTKEFSRIEQFEMEDICLAMEKKFPDAWETDFMWYLNGYFYQDRSDKLMSAYEKAPHDRRVALAMFGYYIMIDNYGKQKEMASRIAGFYSSNTLNYYEDALPASGMLIVSSEKESIPLYVLKFKRGKGKGVHIVNMDHLINKEYRLKMASKLGTESAEFLGKETDFIKAAMSNKNVYLSTTVSQAYLGEMKRGAYLTGLYYQANVSNQKEKLRKFWVKMAGRNFHSLKLSGSEKRLYTNYLPPLMTLYKMKIFTGEKDEVLRKAIGLLAEKVEQTKTVNEILTDYDND